MQQKLMEEETVTWRESRERSMGILEGRYERII